VDWVAHWLSFALEIVPKLPDQVGFQVHPKCWLAERTLGWFTNYRRLSKDYEQRTEYSEAWVYIASIARMLRTLYPNPAEEPPYKRKKMSTTKEVMMPVCA
jgi:putative transposase